MDEVVEQIYLLSLSCYQPR